MSTAPHAGDRRREDRRQGDPRAISPPRLRIGVIGAGRVGSVLGAALARSGHAVVAAAAVSDASRDRAARLLPEAAVLPADRVVAVSDVVLLAVPDDALPGLVLGLAELHVWRPGLIVLHTSGAHGTDVLEPAASAGALTLALHPAMTFSGAPEDMLRLRSTPFAVTARPDHRALAELLVLEMGGEPFWVEEGDRALYHAALVIGSNHLVTLVAEARDLLLRAGVADPAAVLAPLLTAALENGLRRGDRGLTGPVSRGDANTVGVHLDTLTERAPDALPAYLAMARRTTERALRSGVLRPADATDLTSLLEYASLEGLAPQEPVRPDTRTPDAGTPDTKDPS